MNSKKKEKRKHLKDAAREIPDRYWGKKKKKSLSNTGRNCGIFISEETKQ